MPHREVLVVVRDEGRVGATGDVRGLLYTIRQNATDTRWEQVSVRADDTYNEGNHDFSLATNLSVAGALEVGATAEELAGDGVVFDGSPAAGQEITVHIYGEVPGAKTRGTRVPAGTEQRPVNLSATGFDYASSFIIETSGWMEQSVRRANYEVSVRPRVPPTDGYTPRYTTRSEVETILRAAKNQAAGYDSNFGERTDTAIETAELKIDAVLGRTFGPAVSATRNYRSIGRYLLRVDDFVGTTITVRVGDRTLTTDDYTLEGAHTRKNIYDRIRPLTYWLERGTVVRVTAPFGFPVPADVRNYAGKLSADILRDNAMSGGLLETADGGMAYGRIPGKDILYHLGHYRKFKGL